MSKLRQFPRVDSQAQETPFGCFFLDPAFGTTFDLSNVRVVGKGVDTVRQLYHGAILPGVLGLFDRPGLVDFAGKRWHAGRIGRDSGYQYKLQNADLGIILLIKSFHAAHDVPASHLKIEVSPHLIASESFEVLQARMDKLADAVLAKPVRGQAAVHLRLDVQGWRPSDDFEQRLHCRSSRVRTFNTVGSLDFAECSARYTRGESFLFGSASGVQLAVYNKTAEAKAHDKLDFWQESWKASGCFDSAEPVYRIEFRFHQSVIQQFSEGSVSEFGELPGFTGFLEVSQHLTAFWRYGLESFRLLLRPGWLDPFWSLLADHTFTFSADSLEYRRYYKKASGFSGKNVELMLGNFVSLAARHRMTARNCYRALESLPFFEVVSEYYLLKGQDERALRKRVGELLEERYVRWGKAV